MRRELCSQRKKPACFEPPIIVLLRSSGPTAVFLKIPKLVGNPVNRMLRLRSWSHVLAPAFVSVAVLLAVSAQAQENVALKAGTGRDVVEGYCNACHSLDYLLINAPFLNRQGWETEVNKMITAFGAPIGPSDAKIIVDYLVANYGSGK